MAKPAVAAGKSTVTAAKRRGEDSSESDDSDDVAAAAPPMTMQAMVAAIATAITQGFAIAVAAPATPVLPTKRYYSTSIDPYDTQCLEIDTKEGKYQWAMITRKLETWKILAVSVDNADPLMDLFKDRQMQFGLDPILSVPTGGDGAYAAAPCTLAGDDFWDATLTDHMDLLKDIHALTLPQVRAFSGWFMGGEAQTLSISSDMKIAAIDPNESGNVGLVNRHKIRL